MAIIKCKMCGGDLNVEEGVSVAQCEYCGTQQTVPSVSDAKKLTLFARANRLRAACEFDKAAGVYESIVADFPEEAEAYWGLVLCRYGIEYVDDPRTGKKIPTCHRSSFDSVLEDADFEQALENADVVARRIYREEAKMIETLRRGIVEVSGKEEPYDIFICYKETDINGNRTVDSLMAQDVYDALTKKGYRVFFSRITLEEKLGVEYEPYIFAALNSAKLMLVFGTDYEYFNAVWVKNEWNRFLMLMEAGKGKVLIPCYKGIDAYDMPKEFAKLQAQDMGKVGAMQDLLRGVDKIMGQGGAEVKQESKSIPQDVGRPTVQSLTERAQMFLEDDDFENAERYFDRVLDIEPKNAQAYFGKFLTQCGVYNAQELVEKATRFEITPQYVHEEACPEDEARITALAGRYAVPDYLPEWQMRKNLSIYYGRTYKTALPYLEGLAKRQRDLLDGSREFVRAEQFATGDYAAYLAGIRKAITEPEHLKQALDEEREKKEEAVKRITEGYREYLDEQEQHLAEENQKALKEREEDERREEAERIRKAEIERREKKRTRIIIVSVCAAVAAAILYFAVIKPVLPLSPREQYEALLNQGRYDEAVFAFNAIDDQTKNEDDKDKTKAAQYKQAEAFLNAGDLARGAMVFGILGNYKDAKARSYVIWDKMVSRRTVVIGDTYANSASKSIAVIAAIREDGTVKSNQSGMKGWENIIQLAITGGKEVKDRQFVGLTANGTLVCTGFWSAYELSKLSGVVAIASEARSLADLAILQSDGTDVYFSGKSFMRNTKVNHKEVVAVSEDNRVYIDADGKLSFRNEGKHAIAMDTWNYNMIVLNEDQTVSIYKFTGTESDDIKEIDLTQNWNGIAAVRIDGQTTYPHETVAMGIKEDGSILLSNGEEYPPLPDIVTESMDLKVWNSSDIWIYGLNRDGELMVYTLKILDRWSRGRLTDEQAAYEARHLNERGLDVSEWTGIKLPNGMAV